MPSSWLFLPTVLRPPEPTATLSPTPTATATPIPLPTPSPPSTPTVIEDFELGLTDWSNPYSDLDVFQLTGAACAGLQALHIGGADQDNSYVGTAVLSRWGSRLQDWRQKQALTLCVKRGELRRGGRPSLTISAVDRNNFGIVLHRADDQYLSWPGGGWRTIISNDAWTEIILPLRGETGFDWSHVTGLRIEVRRTWSGGWEANPDDVYVDEIALR